MQVGWGEACILGGFGEESHRRDAALGGEVGAEELADTLAGAPEVGHGFQKLSG
jgi:hypothetical protein